MCTLYCTCMSLVAISNLNFQSPMYCVRSYQFNQVFLFFFHIISFSIANVFVNKTHMILWHQSSSYVYYLHQSLYTLPFNLCRRRFRNSWFFSRIICVTISIATHTLAIPTLFVDQLFISWANQNVLGHIIWAIFFGNNYFKIFFLRSFFL